MSPNLLTDEGIAGITNRDIKLSPVYRNFLKSASIVQAANRHTTDVFSNLYWMRGLYIPNQGLIDTDREAKMY